MVFWRCVCVFYSTIVLFLLINLLPLPECSSSSPAVLLVPWSTSPFLLSCFFIMFQFTKLLLLIVARSMSFAHLNRQNYQDPVCPALFPYFSRFVKYFIHLQSVCLFPVGLVFLRHILSVLFTICHFFSHWSGPFRSHEVPLPCRSWLLLSFSLGYFALRWYC